MRPEKLYLTDMVEAAQAIERFMMGKISVNSNKTK